MTLTSGLKRICDLSFYMTFATTVAWMVSSGEFVGFILTLPLFMVSAFWSSHLTAKEKSGYLGLLPLLISLFIIPLTIINIIVLIPAIVLMIYSLPKSSELNLRADYQPQFKLFLKLFLGMIGIMSLIIATSTNMLSASTGPNMTTFTSEVLVFALSFIVCSIVYMRMIRHEKAVQQQRRFQIINFIPVVAVALMAIVFGESRIFYFFTIIINGFLFLLSFPARWFAYLISLPFRTLESPFWDRMRELVSHFGETEIIEEIENYQELYTPAENNIFFIIVGFLIITAMILICRRLIQNKTTIIHNGLEEEYSRLDNRKKALRSRNQNQIRLVYQKFLKLLQRKNMQILSSTTSLEIEQLVVKHANTTSAGKLRQAYINVRYGNREYSRQDVTRVKELYKQIKIELEK